MGHIGFQTLQEARKYTHGISPIPSTAFHADLSFVSGPSILDEVLNEGAKVETNLQTTAQVNEIVRYLRSSR